MYWSFRSNIRLWKENDTILMNKKSLRLGIKFFYNNVYRNGESLNLCSWKTTIKVSKLNNALKLPKNGEWFTQIVCTQFYHYKIPNVSGTVEVKERANLICWNWRYGTKTNEHLKKQSISNFTSLCVFE